MSIKNHQREDAIDSFLMGTNYNGGMTDQDRKTAAALKQFRDEEAKKNKKKRNEKFKRMLKSKEEKREQIEKKKKFMKNLEEATLIA